MILAKTGRLLGVYRNCKSMQFQFTLAYKFEETPTTTDVTNTGNGEPGVWELMYSGNPLENSKWRSKQKKGSKRNNLGKGEFPPAVPPDDQYDLARPEFD